MKKQIKAHSVLSCIVLILLSAAMALSVTACKKDEAETPQASVSTEGVLGEGQTQFTVEVVHLDGTVKTFTVNTDKKTVGEALVEVGLIEGEDSQYGLMISAVDGVTHKYENGGKYWAFYINGAYATSGVDSTEITPDTLYAFKVE